MIFTILFGVLLGVIALGLTRPLDPRRVGGAAIVGGLVAAVAAYFNMYPGSLRAALFLLAVALFVGGSSFGGRLGGRATVMREPLIPRLHWAGAAIAIFLVLAALFPYTEAGANSVDEPLYHDLNNNVVNRAAPALPSANDVRVVPWEVAAQIVVRGYGADASFLDVDPMLLLKNTYPDTVNGEFIWVHAPTPETAKWVFGGRAAEKIVFVRNNQSNTEPSVIGEGRALSVHVDGRFWQDRVQRYALEHGEFRYKLQDYALQLDDSYNPYWIAYMTSIDIRNQPHLEKLIIVDAYTGAEQIVDPEDAPDWVEMVYPETFVYYWAEYWGSYRHGIMYRWFDANRLMQPDDVTVRYIRLGEDTYWLLPMKQLNAPQLGGYILVNTRSGDATFYDRFEETLVDYETAYNQLRAIMSSGEATGGQGRIDLAIYEGYLYPIRMANGSVRDAYVFPLLEGLKVSNFAIIDAHDYGSKRIFAPTVQRAVAAFANLSGEAARDDNFTIDAVDIPLVDGTVSEGRAIVNLNGTLYRVTADDLAGGQRREGDREMDELEYAIARANRGEDVTLRVFIEAGRVVDVTLPGATWG